MQKFKTNIKCGACKAAVAPSIEKLGISSWEVDLNHPDRIVSVSDQISSEKIIAAIKDAGYDAEQIV
ncbi:heavy-metal-associated domain-containing protein [Belliella kenyensis]|uniref:Heavy-metal-associated domain-containing protein n=1 Tax=Belliella kenyensis TaxID=1472724 RepID=A0ABV8EJC9_9BACT|nr:heavy-metal-associated domain-containing protein [Belliella kenyensis]MCH7401301.1 cation transporter [Belliella kenyensis]MDN3602746.1 heavy-metal-associated domain-containing protein [Belliella kenyensis]